MLEEINCILNSNGDITQGIRDSNCSINEVSCDTYVKYNVTPKSEQEKYDDNFDLDNWIIENYPELEGKYVLIHIDY